MKNKILSFALPLFLALSPVAAPAARLLWVDVRGSATVEDGDTNPTVGEYRSSGTGHSVNAFRVSVPDAEASGGTNRLVFAYEENGSMVVGGSEPVVRSLDFADGGALWAPLDLAAYADRNLVVTMELGYVDPASPSSFEKLAFATEHLGKLLDAPHVSIQSDLNPPALLPWSPETFTVTVPWAITYDFAGGTNNAANPEFYTEGQLPIALLPAGREGYTFAGWTNELGAAVEEIGAGSTGDRSFGATWLENVEPPAGASFIYDGTAKTGVPSGTGYSVAGDATATEPGQYTVTLFLESGYIWSDGTTADKTVAWSIAPAVAMTLSVPDEATGVVTTNYFATLQEAIDATASSDPVATNVVLRGDVAETVVVTNSVAIDLAGHELDGDVTNAVPAVIGTSVPGGGITGDIVSEGDSARLTIEGGAFDGELSAPDGGSISITGGHFAKDPSDFVADGYYAAGDDTDGYDVLPCRSIVDATITVGTAVYAGVPQDPSVTVETNGVALVLGTDFTVTYETNALVDAGTYPIAVNGIGAWKDSVPTNFVIAPLAITVKADDKTKTYDNDATTDPALTATVTGAVAGDEIAYTVARAPGQDAGEYAITVTAGENPNYTVSVEAGTFTITKASMTITATGYEGVYDGASHAASATTEPSGATVTWSTDGGATWSDTAPAIVNVGTSEVLAQAALANYATVTSEVAKLIVTPKAVTVTADDKLVTYGDPDAPLTARVSGMVEGESTNLLSWAVSREPGSDVGTYPISVSGADSQGNYAVTFVGGTYTIVPAGTMALQASDWIGVYDGEAHSNAVQVVPAAGTTIRYSVDNGETWTLDAPAITNVGELAVLVQATNANYNAVSTNVALQVTNAWVTATASDVTVGYGTALADIPYAATYAGWATDEDDSVLSTTPKVGYAGYDPATTYPGTYEIAISGAAATNYAFAYVPGTLTVTAVVYSVTYDLAGGSLADGASNPDAYTVTNTFTLENPEKTGHTFAGWTGTDLDAATTSVTVPLHSTGDRAYTATWTADKHLLTIVYVTPDGVAAPETFTSNVVYGTSYSVESPAVTGHTPDIATVEGEMGTEDVSVTVTYTADMYDVIWLADGLEFASNHLAYGAAIVAPSPDPTKDKTAACTYTFAGWVPQPEEMVTSNATYTASFTETTNRYTVAFEWHGGSSSTDYDYGTLAADVTVPSDPETYVENGTIHTFTNWSPAVVADVTSAATYTAQYANSAAVATVITVADATTGATTTNYYATLIAALEAAPADATVQLLADVAEPAVGVDVPITLDLNGKTWTVTAPEGQSYSDAVAVSSAFVVTDSSDGAAGVLDGRIAASVANASVTIDAGRVTGVVSASNGAAVALAGGSVLGVRATGAGSRITVTGGTAPGNNSGTPGVVVDENATATISGTAVVGNVHTRHDAAAYITGGTVDGDLNDSVPSTILASGGHFNGRKPYDWQVADGFVAVPVSPKGYDVVPRKSVIGTTITVADATYDGQEHPIGAVVSGEYTLTASDYTVVYTNVIDAATTNGNDNASAGTVTATIIGIGKWIGSTNVTFSIAKKPLTLVWSDTNLVYTGSAQAPTAAATGIVAGDDVSVVVTGAQTEPGTYTATASLSGDKAGNYALPDPATAEFTITATYVAQVGEEKFFTIAAAVEAAGGLVAEPAVITLLDDADASVTLTAPSQRLRVALDGHELTVLSGDPVRYEVVTTDDAAVADVKVFALEQLKADGLTIVRFDYEAAKLAYDMGTAENMLKMYPTNEPIWCTVATATDLAAKSWTTVESSRPWVENPAPPASATDDDLEWLENLDTESSPIRFWRIAVTPFALSPNEEIGFKPAKQSGE